MILIKLKYYFLFQMFAFFKETQFFLIPNGNVIWSKTSFADFDFFIQTINSGSTNKQIMI